jgi:hypothetical protein
MNLERYHLESEPTLTTYEFVSIGTKGAIHKVIQFSPTNLPNIYNLGLCDKNSQTGELNYNVVTNNGDTQKILATVAASVIAFTQQYPNAWAFAQGNTRSRTRLYQIGIANQIDEISAGFFVFGLYNGEWENFQSNKNYEAFLIKRR